MADEARAAKTKTDPTGQPVRLRPYLITALILLAIPFGGYGLICWRDAYRAAAERCFAQPLRELAPEQEGGITAVAFTPDSRKLLAGGYDGTLRLYDAASGKELWVRQTSTEHPSVSGVAVARDGRRALSCGGDGRIRLWDLAAGKVLLELAPVVTAGTPRLSQTAPPPVEVYARAVAFCGGKEEKQAVSAHADGALRIWDLATGRLVRVIGPTNPNSPLVALAISPDGRLAVTGSLDRTVQSWDLERGQVLQIWPETGSERWLPTAVAFSPDGRLVASSDSDGNIQLRDARTGDSVRGFVEKFGWTSALAFSADGRHLLAGSATGPDPRGGIRSGLRLWEVEGGKPRGRFRFQAPEREQGWVLTLAVSPDGRLIATGGWRSDAAQHDHAELLLWRMPDRLGLWLVGPEKEEPAAPEPVPRQGGPSSGMWKVLDGDN